MMHPTSTTVKDFGIRFNVKLGEHPNPFERVCCRIIFQYARIELHGLKASISTSRDEAPRNSPVSKHLCYDESTFFQIEVRLHERTIRWRIRCKGEEVLGGSKQQIRGVDLRYNTQHVRCQE
jgi:hypothetical protein